MAHDADLDQVRPSEIDLDADALDMISEAFEREVETGRLPGAVLAIGRDRQIGYFESFGQRDPAKSESMAKDAIFRIYSMTKPIVSVAAMQMVEEGRIQLPDPLSAYIPAFADVKVGVFRDGELDLVAPARPITIQDLLRHTSGLAYEFIGGGPVAQLYMQVRISSTNQTNEQHAAALAGLPLLNHPGTVWDYGRSTDVLGRIIEIVDGKSLGESLAERVFEPLEMSDTGFWVPEKDQHRIAEPFAIDPDDKSPVALLNVKRPAKLESGGGGLVSTVHDYARFCAMLANEGALDAERLLGRKTLAWMTSDHLGPNVKIGSEFLPAGHGFGLGFATRLAPGMASAPGSVGSYHWGGVAGTVFWIDPEEDLFAIMMIQAPGRCEYYRHLFRALVYAAVD